MDINMLKRMMSNRVAGIESNIGALTLSESDSVNKLMTDRTYFSVASTENFSKYLLDIGQYLNYTAETNYDIAQVHTLTVVGTVTGAGDAKVVVTADGMDGSPKTIKVPVEVGDGASAVAGKVTNALVADPVINAFFGVTSGGATIEITKKVAAASDATLSVVVDNDTCTGITTSTSSENIAGGIKDKAIEFANVPEEPTNALIRVLFKLKCTLAPTTFSYPVSVTWLSGTPLSPVTGNDYMVEFISYDNGVTWFASLLD